MQRLIASAALAAISLCGCASITTGSSETIAVASTPADGASCVLSNGNGNWTVTTPGTVEVARSSHDMNVKCSKPGYADAAAVVPAKLQPWSVASVVLTGPVGVFVDTTTGAINRYSSTITVPMTPAAQPAQK